MRLKIATKIILAFGVITLAVIINALMTSSALQKSREVNDKISNLYTPSLAFINDLYSRISDSRMLVKSWVFIDKISDTPDKLKLKKLHSTDYKLVMDTLKAFGKIWANEHPEQRDLLLKIDSAIVDTLFVKHQYIMDQLSDFESYDDPFIIFEVTPMTEEGGEVMVLTERILNQIEVLRINLEDQVEQGRIEMVDTFNSFKTRIIIMAIVLVLGALIIGAFTIDSLARPINHTKNILLKMSKGILPKEKLTEGSDEIGQMAKALNLLIQSLKDIFNFSLEIGKGNFDTEFKPLSDEDVLGLSLLEMRDELKKASSEEEKRKEEDKQRNWASQGVAMFSDILRKSSDNLEELSYEIISNMVKYTNSNQGGMFIVNDNDKNNIVLEMSACYAYDRKKFLEKKIEIGEGLVGRCYQEQEKIFLTEIPDDYIKITSGLGDDNPKCLLLIPLVYNNVIYGIIEIASFNVYRPFEVEFIERISESIAATISSVKANIQTTTLLEQSQQQAEEMAAQEEEMRQNMEELRATQEQSARREEDLKKEVEELRKRLKEVSEQ
ncbi:MAG: GAF domain-containing protein [Bacteroidales bacterium]|nr:GAF domain-containing protein [Bacteroidales bacterium]